MVVPAVWWAAMWVADMNHKIDTAEKQLVRTKEECELGVGATQAFRESTSGASCLSGFARTARKTQNGYRPHERDGT